MTFLTTLSTLGFLTIVSSFLGFAREILIAKTFGVSTAADCFIVAFSIVSSVFLIFNTSAIQTAFMPSYQCYIQKGDMESAAAMFNGFLKALTLILLMLALVVFFTGNYYVPWIVPGFDEKSTILTVKTIKILTPLILTLGLSGLFFAISNANHCFVKPLISQLVNNFIIIFFILIGLVHTPIGLAWSFFIAGILSFSMLVIFSLSSIDKKYFFEKDKISFAALTSALPIFFMVIFEQFGATIQKTIASGFEAGSIAALNYAYKLASFPVTIFVVPISIIFFPTLINYIESDSSDIDNYFKKGINLIMFLLLPATLFFATNSENIVSACFGSKNFDVIAIKKTSSALFFYSFGLIAQGLLIYLNKVYFAYKKAFLFLKLNLIGGGVHVFACWAFCKFLGHIGIAIGTSIYSIINALLLFFYLNKFSNLTVNFRIFTKPTLAVFLTFPLTYFISTKNGMLFLMINMGLTSTLFYGLLWIIHDREFRKIITNFDQY